MSDIVEKVKQKLFDAFNGDAAIAVESASLIEGKTLILYGEWDADAIARAAIAAYEAERDAKAVTDGLDFIQKTIDAAAAKTITPASEVNALSARIAALEEELAEAKDAMNTLDADGFTISLDEHVDMVERDRDIARDQWRASKGRIAELEEALTNAVLQIEYLHDRFRKTGSGNAVLSRARAVLEGKTP